MKIVAIIPARMESTRFPGKPLEKILGMEMIGHCILRTKMCNHLLDTYVATCNQEIADYIESIGCKVVMTKSSHQRATDRTAEAMLKIEEDLGFSLDVVVMVQGDEPMVTPEMITLSLQPFSKDSSVNVVNLMSKLITIEEFEDPNEVKVVVDKNNDAIYFSREPIPSRKKWFNDILMLKQVCVIPFKRDYLIKFNNMVETELEKVESVDMLRIIENGEKVKMVYSNTPSYSVDTQQDLDNVEKIMRKDALMQTYLHIKRA
jgi:3-deoxy-manno-octulosonate cytidylyltransferase (CMP-KDO synthetase)